MSVEPRLPYDLRDLPVVETEIAYRIGDGHKFPSLEGCLFDRSGAFYVCYTIPNDTTIYRITKNGEKTVFFHINEGMVIGLALHPDGRFFAADMLRNSIRILTPDGELEKEVFPIFQGSALKPDCMVFDPNGDLLFTDLRGTIYNPVGGIYRLHQRDGYGTCTQVLGRLASPNGLQFSPDYSMLWYVESNRNTLACMQLREDYTLLEKQYSPIVTYQNTGKPNMDSLQVDVHGNVYCGIMFGGRAMVFDSEGIPCANIVLPRREKDALRYTPNLALRYDASEGYLLASDEKDALVLRFASMGCHA